MLARCLLFCFQHKRRERRPIVQGITSGASRSPDAELRKVWKMNLMLKQATTPVLSLRDAMRHLVGGVCVVTAGVNEDRTGTTVTSATSLSLDPPTMVACVNRNASVLPIIRRYRHFCINILADSQRQIAERFAGQAGLKGAARYHGTRWSALVTGAGVLDDALASIDCELAHDLDWHSHTIVLGAVRDLRTGSGHALVYSHGRYGSYGGPS
jgi:flavin reductase (DIM6/NTAB) family NADH-FMN oxidoreductase RutF